MLLMPEHRRSKPKNRPKPIIMVVDDEPVIRETLLEILSDEGFDALGMSTAGQALRWIELIAPDIVLTDVNMPGMNGIELGIKVREILPGCRVVLVSGHAATGKLLQEAEQRGHKFEILTKPIRPEGLLSRLRSNI
jgi:DNA-binding NtrC family response regulator